MKRKIICIICKKERKGARVLDDIVISNIRKIKQKFGIAQNNILVVCDGCMPAYKQKRATFEKYFVVWAGLAFLILIFHLLVSPTLTGIAFSILLIILFSALSLIRYSPRVEKHG